MKHFDGNNRRKYRRAQMSGSIQAMVDGSGLKMLEALDISEGGIRVTGTTGAPLKQNMTLKLFVPMPGHLTRRSQLCLMTGRVVWTSAFEAGIEFVDSPTESRAAVSAFVKAQAWS